MKVSRSVWSITLFATFFLFYLCGNGNLPITDPVESNYALSAKEMVLSGDWISPQIYHAYWFDKPVFVYWGIALSYTIFGISSFAARFPSALAGGLTILLVYRQMLQVQQEEKVARYTAISLGTMLMVWVISHAIITDAWLLLFTAGTFFYAYRGLHFLSWKYMMIAYAFAGCAVLTKGPVGFILPGIFLLLYSALQKQGKLLRIIFSWQGIVAFIAIAGPWYTMMYQLHGLEFINGFLGLHNITRATVSEHPSDNVWWYYLAITPVAILPWTGASIYGIWKYFKVDRVRDTFKEYSLIWAIGTIVFYTVMATKYPTYTYISVLPFAIFSGIGVSQLMREPKKGWIFLGPALFLWILWAIASRFSPWGTWFWLYVVLAVFAVALLWLWKKECFEWIPVCIAIGTMSISQIVLQEAFIPWTYERSMVAAAEKVESTKGQIYYYNQYSTSLVFYTHKDITMLVPTLSGDVDATKKAWSGKWTMPKTDFQSVEKEIVAGKTVVVLVESRLNQSFLQHDFAKKFTLKNGEGMLNVYISK